MSSESDPSLSNSTAVYSKIFFDFSFVGSLGPIIPNLLGFSDDASSICFRWESTSGHLESTKQVNSMWVAVLKKFCIFSRQKFESLNSDKRLLKWLYLNSRCYLKAFWWQTPWEKNNKKFKFLAGIYAIIFSKDGLLAWNLLVSQTLVVACLAVMSRQWSPNAMYLKNVYRRQISQKLEFYKFGRISLFSSVFIAKNKKVY